MVSKFVLVTGASRGIGASIARAITEKGMGVIIVSRNAEALNNVANYIQSEGGVVHPLAVDLSIASDVDKLAAYIDKIDGDLKAIVHNAGVARVGKVSDISVADWRRVIDVNLTAPFVLSQKLLPKMRTGGQIIFINSVAGKNSFPEWAAYSASKAGLRAFADTLRAEVRAQGIRVTNVFPSSVDTLLHDELNLGWVRSKTKASGRRGYVCFESTCRNYN